MLIGEDKAIWSLYLEGAAEDMITSSLKKSNATPEEISLFIKKDNGKNLYKPEHVPVLFKWVKEQNANVRELEDDYKAYQKFFPNVKLNQFNSYIDWTEKVHAKRDESSYQSRNKEIKDIEVEGQDKENVLADDENVLILKGDDEHKCVRYGKGYSFCISRPFGGNMYGTYRLSKASTFYFVYFKKIPKKDERHIMVLDRTKDGWEWTFGKNKTRKVKGGWDEIVKTFPVLAKYESLFVNKPLIDKEKVYLKQLKEFAGNPNLQKFNEFTIEQKADALKFGMKIPLDLFKSLDKYLRNEWISVGPKMSDDIYKLLKENEIKRFEEVRKQQLLAREPEDIYDVEICKKDPELYVKHIKPDIEIGLKEEKEITSKIKDGVFNGDILITSKYHLPNLNDLKTVFGNISAFNKSSINLSQLQTCSEIYIPLATTINLSQLQECNIINAYAAIDINLKNLQKCRKILTPSAININIPKLISSEIGIYIDKVTNINLPELQKVGNLHANSAINISLPKLKEAINIHNSLANSISLPQLKKSQIIFVGLANNLNLPKLKEVNFIVANSAKKIIIPLHLTSKIQKAPEDCKIIEPSDKEELNDSFVYDLMKTFLLKS